MTDDRGVLLATKRGADALKRQLARSPQIGGSSTDHTSPDHLIEPVLAEFLVVPQDGDKYTLQPFRQVRRFNDTMEFVQRRNGRLTGGRPLLVQSGTQMVAVCTSLHLDVQLTEALEPATAFHNSPSTALANVLTRNDSGNLEKLTFDGSDVQLTVTNRWEAWDTVPVATFGGVILKNDEWRPDDFDCEAAAGGLI
jgi:hypothetical protein